MKVGRDGVEREGLKVVSDRQSRRIEVAYIGRRRAIDAAFVDETVGVVIRRRVVQIHVLRADVISRQIKCYLGSITEVFEGQSTTRLVRVWKRFSQGGVGEISVRPVVEHAQSREQPLRHDGAGYHSIQGLLIETAVFNRALAGQSVAGEFRHEFYRAANVAAAKERALRAFQNLDSLDIHRAYRLPFELLNVIDIETDALDDSVSTHAAQYHIRRVVRSLSDIQIRSE